MTTPTLGSLAAGVVGSPAAGIPATEVEADVAARMRIVIGRLGRRLRLTHPDTELSPSQHEVLGMVVRRGPLRLSELADLEALNPTMLSRIAGKLEGAGLVVRSQDAEDRRVAYLTATQSGRDLYAEILTERTHALVLALGQLSEQERHTLGTALPVLESLAEALKRRAQ